MINPWVLGILVLAFLLGSIPFDLLLTRLFKLKTVGGQAGEKRGKLPEAFDGIPAVKMWPFGVLIFLLQFIKAAFSVFLVSPYGFKVLSIVFANQPDLENYQPSVFLVWLTGFVCILGHCFSPWLNFKGGKGLVPCFGILLVLSPISALFALLGFGFTFFYKKEEVLSSVAGLILASIACLVFESLDFHLWIGAAIVLLILIRHEESIDVLLEKGEV